MQARDPPVVKDLVLIGGGHSHIAVIKRFGMRPIPGVRVTVIGRDAHTPYSGMLPGLIAGHYTHDESHIDLVALCRFAGARFFLDEACGLDPAQRLVLCRGRPPVPWDVLSIDIGSSPRIAVPGAAGRVVAVKPIGEFLAAWEALAERVLAARRPMRVAVVGAGAGGVELLLAAQHRLGALCTARGPSAPAIDFHLFTDAATILPTYNARARRSFGRILHARGVSVHAGSAVMEVTAQGLRTADGVVHPADEVLWVTEAGAAPWLAGTGLTLDAHGFIAVSPTLQSLSHDDVFAAGDIAAMVEHPRPKSGVFAVRQGPALTDNLARRLLGRRLRRFVPQQRFLSLVSTGDRYAVASRGAWSLQGAWVWRWKDRIDRRFMRKYQDLPEMPAEPPAALPRGLADEAALAAALADAGMRCGGCGAKLGAMVLRRAIGQLQPLARADVLIGLGDFDDAAMIAVPPGKAMVHTVDFFRAMIDDPYVFGKVAANHCLGDIHAMGAEPQTALAIATVPFGPDAKMADTLAQMMRGATEILNAAGAALVGGHSGEGSELALGFAVNGLADPDRVMRKNGLRPGDRLVLTKPLGTGTLFAADMRHRAKGRWIVAALASMTQSSGAAADCLMRHGARGCTDVTGFGLLGHLVEMVEASGVDAALDLAALPLLAGAEATLRAGFASSLAPQNRSLVGAIANPEIAVGDLRFALLFDPQTAGGLLAGIAPDQAAACVAALRSLGYAASVEIGTVLPRGAGAPVHLRGGADAAPPPIAGGVRTARSPTRA